MAISAAAFDRAGGHLWLASRFPKDSLFRFNPTTGVMQGVAGLPFSSPVVGMAFDGQNRLYSLVDNGTGEFYLATLNLSTGEATPVSVQPINASNLFGFAIDPDSVVTSILGETALPTAYALEQNYPNPFNPSTEIRYQTSEVRRVRLSVFDLLGREVSVLVDEVRPPGVYSTTWVASQMPAGLYFCRLTAGAFTQVRKMILVK
jgi:hypothetical protein